MRRLLRLRGRVMTYDLAAFLPHVTGLLFGLERNGQGGLALNIALALAAIPLSLLLGAAMGTCRALGIRPLGWIAAVYTELVKYVPLLLMVFWMHYALPAFLGLHLPLFVTAVAALVVYGTAAVTEVFRSGIMAVNPVELEAARLSGLSRWQAARHVLMPQVLRLMLPALLGVTVTLFKDSSIVFVIGLVELTQTGMMLANRYPALLLPMYAAIGLGFMAVSLALAWCAERLRRRIARRMGMGIGI